MEFDEKFKKSIDVMERVFERPLNISEMKQVRFWIEKDVSQDKIIKAYGLMMKNCDHKVFAYMAKIIEVWVENE